MEQHIVTPSLLNRTTFANRENQFVHHTIEEEMVPFYLMVDGDREAMLAARRGRTPSGTGTVSKDPLRNAKYLFVSTVTMACRFCIDAGLDPSVAFNASDLYIQRVDECDSIDEISAIAEDMMLFYCDMMSERKRRARFARPIARSMNYIDAHLHDRFSLQDVADFAGVSRTYLSALFPKETGITLNEYILQRRIEAAENLLRFGDMTVSEIAAYLAFANHSHLDRAFKRVTGETPNAYRRRTAVDNTLPRIGSTNTDD